MKPINILLVEDSEGDIMLITEALEEGNVSNEINIVKNGWEAMQYLKKVGKYADSKIPDLVLLDVNMPKMNGHEVLSNMKADEQLKHIPVIMLTTSSSEEDVYKAYRNYVNCYITKPHEANKFSELVTTIENFWGTTVRIPHSSN
jgi:CheY-like chemotaxis protein